MSIKRLSCIIFICSLLPVVCGCDLIYRFLQKEGAEEKKILGEVVPFTYNPIVEEVQKLLKIYGYKSGKIDGKFGATTREAIALFQEEKGLKVSRFVDKETWSALHFFSNAGLVKSGEIDIAAVQTALNNAGFYQGKVDGKTGPKTRLAIKEFQKANGLKPDSNIGPKTLVMLMEHIAAP